MNALARFFAGLLLVAQVDADRSEAELKDILFPFYGREAAAYEFSLDRQHEQKLELRSQPILTWTNAERYMGAVFVWTYRGRPEMIGCIGSHQNRPGVSNVFHEFHSLSLQPLEPVDFGHGKQKWVPSRAGIELAAVEGVPVPSGSERPRLTQMRNIAREFNGWMKDGEDVTELRLLPQPIVRYRAPESGVIDGAIFALVWKGTDPEILLVLEDRKGEGENRWQFALARFNFREMWVKRNDREIWRVKVTTKSEAYITSMVGERALDDVQAKSDNSVHSASPK